MMRSRPRRWITSVAMTVLLLPGCGDTDDAAADTMLAATTTIAAATTIAVEATTTTTSATTTQPPTTTTTDATNEAEAEVLATVEGFRAAVNAHDTEAIREYVVDDCTWQSTGPVQTLDEYLAHVDRYYEATEFHVEVTSDPVVSRDGDQYVVVQQEAATFSGFNGVGTSTSRLVEVNGEWLIREVRWVEEAAGSTE